MITRRTALKGLGALVASSFATVAYGFGVEARGFGVKTYRLTPPRWPPGYKVTAAIIADPHVIEPWMGIARLREIVQTTNELGAEIILLLGDYAAGRQLSRLGTKIPAAAWSAELAKLKAPLGVHAVLGNHDWWDEKRRSGDTPDQPRFTPPLPLSAFQ